MSLYIEVLIRIHFLKQKLINYVLINKLRPIQLNINHIGRNIPHFFTFIGKGISLASACRQCFLQCKARFINAHPCRRKVCPMGDALGSDIA